MQVTLNVNPVKSFGTKLKTKAQAKIAKRREKKEFKTFINHLDEINAIAADLLQKTEDMKLMYETTN